MKKLMEKKYWLVVPPKPTMETLEWSCINMTSLAVDAEKAWDKFCGVSLKKDAYQADGYKAVEVIVRVMI